MATRKKKAAKAKTPRKQVGARKRAAKRTRSAPAKANVVRPPQVV